MLRPLKAMFLQFLSYLPLGRLQKKKRHRFTADESRHAVFSDRTLFLHIHLHCLWSGTPSAMQSGRTCTRFGEAYDSNPGSNRLTEPLRVYVHACARAWERSCMRAYELCVFAAL